MPFFFVLVEQSFSQTDSQHSSVQLLGCRIAVHPPLVPRVIFLWHPSPLALLFQQTPLCLPQMPFRLSCSCLALTYPTGKMFPRAQAAALCCRNLFLSCRRLNWTVWAGSIPHSHGLCLVPQPSLWEKTIFFTTAHKKWKWSVIN